MKTRLVLPLLAALVSLPAFATSDIAWQKSDFPAILKSAAEQSKPVMIDFYAVWCGPCKQMDKVTFANAKVVETASKFVMAKFDAEKGEGIDLAERFLVGSYPTIVFLGPDGNELNRFTGYQSPENFMPYMELTLEGKSRLDLRLAKLEKDPNDLEQLAEVAHEYVLRQDETAFTHLDKIESLDPANQEGALENAYLMRADYHRRKDDYLEAARSLEALLGKGLELEGDRSVLSSLGVYWARAKEPEKSLAAYQKLIEKYPDPGSYNAMAWEFSQRGINLEAAEEAGLKAVELAGDDPGIMDTLAEVYYAQGRYEDAIALAEKEVALEPDDVYFKDQLEKYREAQAQKLAGAM